MKTLHLVWIFMLFSTTLSSLYASLFLKKTFEVNGLKYDRLIQNSGDIVYFGHVRFPALLGKEHRNFPGLLSITTSLKNSSTCPGDKITLYCDIKNADSYHWFKDGKLIKITSKKLNIHRFKERKHVGFYECEGRGSKNQSVRTKAWIKMHDSSCCPQKDIYSECVPFVAAKCLHIKSFAPRARNLNISMAIYKSPEPSDMPIHKYFPVLQISWEVPRQGRRDIWGWRINVFGISNNNPGSQTCYQINRARGSIMNLNFERLNALLQKAGATYRVCVQALPSMDDDFKDTVICKNVIVPGWCELLGDLLPCCNASIYINASLGSGKNNITTLFWTTQYPPNLHISIDKFIISWRGQTDKCNFSATVLGPNRSNYTFPNLQESCGNYTISIEARLLHPGIECPVPSIELMYILQVGNVKPTPGPVDKKTTLKVVLAVSSVIVAALLVAMYFIKRPKGKSNADSRVPMNGSNNAEFKVFILHPGHCNKCKNVLHSLGSLLHTTGYITCNIDMWVPKSEMVQGPQQWINRMMEENDYVLIPWLCKIDNKLPRKGTKDTRSTGITNFFHGLTYKAGMIAGDPNKNGKFFTLYLDHSSFDVIPTEQKVGHAFQIPSQIDELVMELIGTAQRGPGLIKEIPDVNSSYKNAKTNLINNIKRCHPD